MTFVRVFPEEDAVDLEAAEEWTANGDPLTDLSDVSTERQGRCLVVSGEIRTNRTGFYEFI